MSSLEYMVLSPDIKIDSNLVDSLTEKERGFVVGNYFPALREVHNLYLAQEEQGFYPKGLSRSDLLKAGYDNPELLSPYTLVRRNLSGELSAVPYIEQEPFISLLPNLAKRLENAANYAISSQISECSLIAVSLRPRADAIRRGNFHEAMASQLNSLGQPALDIFVGLDDRYRDDKLNVKLSFEGWVTKRDEAASIRYNDFVQQAIKKLSGHQLVNPNIRVIACESLASGGLAADRQWSGNTIPSETDLRRDIGSISYLFLNNLRNKFRRSLKQSVIDHIPSALTERQDWENAAFEGFAFDLIGHEVGHSTNQFPPAAEEDIQNNYNAVNELTAEIGSQLAILSMPERILSRKRKEMALYASLVWWMEDAYAAQGDKGIESQVGKTYAKAAAMGLNYYERARAIKIDERGGHDVVTIIDLDRFLRQSTSCLAEIRGLVRDAGLMPRMIKDWVRLNVSEPTPYLGSGLKSSGMPQTASV